MILPPGDVWEHVGASVVITLRHRVRGTRDAARQPVASETAPQRATHPGVCSAMTEGPWGWGGLSQTAPLKMNDVGVTWVTDTWSGWRRRGPCKGPGERTELPRSGRGGDGPPGPGLRIHRGAQVRKGQRGRGIRSASDGGTQGGGGFHRSLPRRVTVKVFYAGVGCADRCHPGWVCGDGLIMITLTVVFRF